MSILIIVYHFWPKSLKWPFRLRLFLTKYYYFRANFNILRRNIAIFDRRKLFYLIWPFLTKTWSIAISPRFWPFLTVFGHFDYFCREFDYFWPNRAICDQFLTISDFFWPNWSFLTVWSFLKMTILKMSDSSHLKIFCQNL